MALLLVVTGWVSTSEDLVPTNETASTEAAIEATYDRLVQAYETANVDLILDQYADDAYYLIGSAQRILQGKEELGLAYSHLQRAKEKGMQTTIAFRIVDRTIQNDLAYDIGYFKLTKTRADGESRHTAHKFTTVLKKQADGSWRFQVDSYSDAMLPAFDKVDAE